MTLRFKYPEKLPPILRNKYFVTLSVFIIWIFLLDGNNLVERYGQMKELKKLRKDSEYYQQRIEEDKKKLEELKTDNNNLEKFAREQYRMKRKDEDLYLVITPSEERKLRDNRD